MSGVVTQIYSSDTESGSFSESITLTGNADVLAVGVTWDGSDPEVVNLTDGGSVDVDLLVAIRVVSHGRNACIFWWDVREIPGGTYTLSISTTSHSGFVAWELQGVDPSAVEVTVGEYTDGGGTSISATLPTVTNGASAVAVCGNASYYWAPTSADGILENLQDFGDSSYASACAAYVSDAGTAGEKTVGFTFSTTGYYNCLAAAAWTSSGEIPPVNINITFSGVQSGSEVRIYETPHEAIWTVDTVGLTPATAEETVLTWNAWVSGVLVLNKLWLDLDNNSTIPAAITATAWAGSTSYSVDDVVRNGNDVYTCTTAGTSAASGGPTGYGTGITDGSCVWSHSWRIHEADISTGNDDEDIATEIAATVNAADGVSASASTTVVTVTHSDDGQIAIPTTDAAAEIDIWQIGSASEDEIDGIETTSGDWVSTISVGSPRLCDIAIVRKGGAQPWRLNGYRLDRVDATIPVQQQLERNYSDPE